MDDSKIVTISFKTSNCQQERLRREARSRGLSLSAYVLNLTTQQRVSSPTISGLDRLYAQLTQLVGLLHDLEGRSELGDLKGQLLSTIGEIQSQIASQS